MLQPHVGQNGRRHVVVGPAGPQAEAGHAAQQHRVVDRQRAEVDVLGYIAHAPRPLAGRQAGQILPVKENRAALRLLKAQQQLEQRGLARAVLPQQDADPPVLQRQIHAGQHRGALAVAKAQTADV